MNTTFKAGDIVLYKNGDSYELGVIKRKNEFIEGNWFVYYHTGDTSASTPQDRLFKLKNEYAFNIERKTNNEE